MVNVLSLVLHSFAYIEFSDQSSVQTAIGLHETLFRGRVLKVKSTMLHGVKSWIVGLIQDMTSKGKAF